MSDSRRSLPGSLLRCGIGLLLIAMGLRWIVVIVQSSWPWLAGLLAVSAAAWLAVRWWRSRRVGLLVWWQFLRGFPGWCG